MSASSTAIRSIADGPVVLGHDVLADRSTPGGARLFQDTGDGVREAVALRVPLLTAEQLAEVAAAASVPLDDASAEACRAGGASRPYVARARDALAAEVPGLPDDLLDLYTLLVLQARRGRPVTSEDVHDAWAVWTSRLRPGHRSLVPFDALTPEVQALDDPYRDAIARAADVLDGGENPRLGCESVEQGDSCSCEDGSTNPSSDAAEEEPLLLQDLDLVAFELRGLGQDLRWTADALAGLVTDAASATAEKLRRPFTSLRLRR